MLMLLVQIILTLPLLSEDQDLYHFKSYIISKEQKHNEKQPQEHYLNPFINTKLITFNINKTCLTYA